MKTILAALSRTATGPSVAAATTLLNIIKLNYMDLPVFMDVASIVSGYYMQTGVRVNGTLDGSARGRPGHQSNSARSAV